MAPLTSLLKKDAFKWSQITKESFYKLKKAMCSTPILAMPDFPKILLIKNDSSRVGLGVVLMQEERPLNFTSKALSSQTLGRSTFEKDMLAITHANHK